MGLLGALLMEVALPSQVSWRFEELAMPVCPNYYGQPQLDPMMPRPVVGSGIVTVTWCWFAPNAPALLVIGCGELGQPPMPCLLVRPDFVLPATTNYLGQVRFMWRLPASAPVPPGTTVLGYGQVVELDAGCLPVRSSYPFSVACVRQ